MLSSRSTSKKSSARCYTSKESRALRREGDEGSVFCLQNSPRGWYRQFEEQLIGGLRQVLGNSQVLCSETVLQDYGCPIFIYWK